MIPHTVSQVCWSLALLSTAAYALWRGGRPERLAACACLIAHFATILLQRPEGWLQPEAGLIVVDVGLTLTFGVIMIRARRWWPVAAFAFQILSFAMPIMRFVDPQAPLMGFYVSAIIWNYVGLLVLAIGVRLEGASRDPEPTAGGLSVS